MIALYIYIYIYTLYIYIFVITNIIPETLQKPAGAPVDHLIQTFHNKFVHSIISTSMPF